MNELLLSVALAAGALSNFPRDAGGKVTHAAIGVSIGGAPAVVVPAGEVLAGLRADGGTPAGLPLELGPDEVASGSAAAADMDGDGRVEIAVATASGKVLVVGGGPGFPARLGARVRAGVSFGDVDGDGRPELLIGDERGRIHALKRGGTEAKGFPLAVGAAVTSTVSTSSFAGGRSVAVGCEDGRVHVLDAATGREREGFPLQTHFTVSGAPVFVDLDDDGEMDLVAASQDFAVYAVDRHGAPLRGFPVTAGYRIYEGAAIADLDGDGRLDVVFASADGVVHAVDRAGRPLPGFPVTAGTRIFGAPAIGDLDRDGALDVAVALADGTVHAFDRAGRPLAGFPEALGGEATASPLLADLGDGGLSIVVGLASGEVHAVRAERAGAAVASAPWPAPGGGAGHGGRHGPNPPSYRDLAIAPSAPRVTDALAARFRGVWLDAAPGEAAPAPHVAWLRDGAPVKELDGRRELAAGTARRGERWRFVLTGPGGARFEAPEVVVADSAPGAPAVALEPAAPSRAAPVRAVVARAAPDADGDRLEYRIAWLQDGVDTGVTGESFPGDRLRKGTLLAARVVATDGALDGPAALAEGRVGDTAPGALAVALEPAAPAVTDRLAVRVERPATDPDGDALVQHQRWKVDGRALNLPLSTAALPAGAARKHQQVEVEVRAFDGEREGPPASAAVTLRNTPPGAPKVALLPARPRRGEALRVVVAAPAPDPDGDPIAYRFAWRKNGAPLAVAGDGREVPGAEVAKGDRFEVEVVASDGEASGPAATAAVTVANTPPTPPRIALEPAHPRGGEPVRLVVVAPARDPDGEAVRLAIAWTRDGRATGAGAETLAPTDFHKHERIRVTVTPRDPDEAGPAAVAEVVVDDAPPGAPAIAFSSERPTVAAPLAIAIRTPAADADGDALRYRYRWLRDGVPVPLPDASEASRRPPYWTETSEVPRSALAKGQRWAVEVQAWDGERYGPSARAEVTIRNTPPPAPRIAFAPERPRRVDGLALALSQPPDADGDVITYRFAWFRDGVRHDAPPDQAQLPRGVARKGERWSVEVVASDGEAEAPPARAEVVLADTAPGATAVALCDGPVPAGTVLEGRLLQESSDADGDAVTYRREWAVNGKPVPAMAGQARLTAPALRKHDVVRLVVTPFDGELAGPAATAECEVANTPPAAPVVGLEPAEPLARTGLQVAVRTPSADRDGDAVTYRYAWTRDGLPAPFEGASVPSGVVRHGEVWRVEVTPFDGEAEGERIVATAVIGNTPPTAPTLRLRPDAPVVGDAVTCDVAAPQLDADQEPIAITWRWSRDGRPEPVADGSAVLPAGVVRRGERWGCEAWASDGTATSPHASAEVTVRNSPPPAPKVVIEPERPLRTDDLVCRVATAAVDPDADPVGYTYQWWRDDRPMPAGADPARIESARIAKGQRWRCAATPGDGALTGPAGSAERTVANTPPGPARVRIEPDAPREGEPLRCVVTAASEDVDGDPVRYRLTWLRNGAPQPFAETSQEVPSRLVKAGDRWRCQVVPNDGTEDGPQGGSEERLILPGSLEGGPGPQVVGRPEGRVLR